MCVVLMCVLMRYLCVSVCVVVVCCLWGLVVVVVVVVTLLPLPLLMSAVRLNFIFAALIE